MDSEGKKLNWQQACQILGCGKTRFYQLINNGELPAFRVGKRGLWVREEDCRSLVQPICQRETTLLQSEKTE